MDKKQNRALVVGASVFIAVTAVGFLIYLGALQEERRGETPGQQLPAQAPGPTREEVLKSLSAPSENGITVSEKERKRILESLSAPSKGPRPSEKEKEEIVRSLSAPPAD